MSEPILRKAAPQDALALAELMDQAGEGIPGWLWALDAQNGQSAIDVGMVRARRDTGGFSYVNATVLVSSDAVAGMLLAYRLAEEFDLEKELQGVPDFLVPLVELECLAPGSFYINAIAVYPEHRSKGFGSILITEAERQAREQGADALSLIAFEGNTGAVRLYQRLGFAISASRPVVAHESTAHTGNELLMIRQISETPDKQKRTAVARGAH